MKQNASMVVGPYVGEFGWEVISWEPLVRGIFMQGRHEKCIVFGTPGRSLLYQFAEYREVEIPKYEEECLLWHDFNKDKQAELKALGDSVMKGMQAELGPQKQFAWFWYDRIQPLNDPHYMQGRPDLLVGDADGTKEVGNRTKKDDRKRIILCVRDRGMSDYRNLEYADWYELAEKLSKDNNVTVIGIVREPDNWEMPDSVVDLTNKTTVNDCINLFCGHCDLAVGGNTGTIHLAARCGRPQLIWGNEKVVQRSAETSWMGADYHVYKWGWEPKVDDIVEATDYYFENGEWK